MWKYWSTCLLVAAVAAAGGFLLAGYGSLSPFRDAWEGWLLATGLAGHAPVRVPELQLLACILVALFMSWVTIDVVRFRNALLVLVLSSAVLAAAPLVLALYGVLFEPVAALVSMAVAFCLGTAFSGSPAGARRHRAIRLLGGRASPAVVGVAARPGSPLERPSRRDVSVVTVRALNTGDLVDASDTVAAAGLQARFFDGCRAVLANAGAVVDRVAPDCLVATFGAVGDPADDGAAAAACRAAVAVRDAGRKLSGDAKDDVGEPLRFGVSVATARAVAGVFGPGADGVFGVSSEATELGARLAAANRTYGSRLLISAKTRAAAEPVVEVRPVEMVFDPVSRSLVEVYELLGMEGDLSPEARERRDRFWEGVVLARAGRHQEALKKLESAMTGEETDFPLEYMLSSVRKELASSKSGQGGATGRKWTPGDDPDDDLAGGQPWTHAKPAARF